MKCPLLAHENYDKETFPMQLYEECLEGECAWWDKDKDMCFRASEVLELRLIRSLLREIRDKEGG